MFLHYTIAPVHGVRYNAICMDSGLSSFTVFLSIVWFVLYWILGGVFFAVIAIIRLGRVRKVRFSCLFTVLALTCGIGAAQFGMKYAQDSIRVCEISATRKAQQLISTIGCGLGEIIGTFLIGVIVLILIGFVLMELSKSKTKPWIVLDHEQEEKEEEDEQTSLVKNNTKQSKYF